MSAELTLQMEMTVAGSEDISLHRVLSGWGEGASSAGGGQGGGAPAATGDATWFHTFFDSALWASPGGDFAAAPSATQSVGGSGAYTWGSTGQMVADVQAWVDNPGSNQGWLLMGNESSGASAKAFSSRESGSGPLLVVTFNAPVPATGPSLLALLGLLLALLGVLCMRWKPAPQSSR